MQNNVIACKTRTTAAKPILKLIHCKNEFEVNKSEIEEMMNLLKVSSSGTFDVINRAEKILDTFDRKN